MRTLRFLPLHPTSPNGKAIDLDALLLPLSVIVIAANVALADAVTEGNLIKRLARRDKASLNSRMTAH